jgi:hypothetical protein
MACCPIRAITLKAKILVILIIVNSMLVCLFAANLDKELQYSKRKSKKRPYKTLQNALNGDFDRF